MFWLFVDDERDVQDHWPEELKNGQDHVVVIRTYDAAIDFINDNWEEIEVISLDHDLGELSDKKTGYEIACFIEALVWGTSHCPKKLVCHSANPVGWKKIMMTFDAIKRHEND